MPEPLQLLDYVRFPGGATGTVFEVIDEHRIRACTSETEGRIERMSSDGVVLLVRNGKRVAQ